MADNTPLGFTSAMSMGDLSFDDATSPYITKLTEAGLGFETKRLLARQANLEKLASLEGYRKGYILGADDEGAGIDPDSGLVQDDATGDVYRFRMRQASNYDAVDNADVVAKSRNKMSYQPEYVAQLSGKRIEDLTEFDFKNVKNYQTQETFARWNDPDRPSIPYDPNFIYKTPDPRQRIPVYYKSTGSGFYGRDLTDMINPKTGRSMTFDAAMNPYLNASFQLNDYMNTEANRRRIDEFNALPVQPMKDRVNQDKVNRLFVQPTNNRYPRTFNSKNLPMDEILKKYDADVPFYQQWMDQLGYNIDKAQASLHQVVGHLARIIPGTNKKYWESLDKPVNEQGMTLADVLHGVDPTQFAIHQRHVAENQAIGDQAAEEWNKGNYISAGVKSLDYLRRSIIDVNYLLADSFGQMAASSGGQMIGGAIGGALGGKAGAAVGAVTTGAMITAFDETVQVYDDYKQKNNGETMSPARILATFGAHLVAAVPEQILQKIGLQKVLPNPIAKAIFKNEEKLVTRAAADIPEAMSKKGLWEVAKQAGSGFMKGGLAEMGQEGFQNFVSAYASQDQKNARSMLDVATDREQVQAALSGFAMGGAMHGTASALGANKSLKAEKAMALMQEGFAKTRQMQTTAGSDANQDASTQIINTVNNTVIDKNTSVDDSLKIAKDMHEQGISLNINTDAEEAVRKKEAEAYVNAATKLHAEGASKEKIKEVTGKSSEDILTDYALMSNYNAQDAFTHNRNRTVQSIKKMESELYKIAEDIGLTKEEAKKTLQQVAYDVRRGPNGFEVYGEKIRKGNQELLRTDLSEDERKHIEKTTDLYTLRMVNLMSNQVNKLDAFARGLEDIVLGKGNEIRISYPYSDGTLEDSGFTIKGKYIALDDPNLKKGAFGVMDDIYDSIKEMETFFNDRTNIPEDKLKASVATYNKNNKSMQLKFDEIESIKKRIDNAVVKIKDLGVKEFASTERVTEDTAKDYSKRVKDVVTAINKKKTESKTFVKQARSLVSVLSQQEDAYDKIVEGINNNKKFSESEKAGYINYLTDLRDSLKNTAKRMAEIREEYPGVKQNAKDLLAANTADILDKQILKEGEKDPEAYAKATRPLTVARDNVQKALNNFKAVSTGSGEDTEIIKNLADLYNDLTKRINNNRVTFNNATKGITKPKTNESQSTNIDDNASANAFPILTQDLLDKIFKNKTNDTIDKHIRNLKKMLKDKEEKTKLYKTDKNTGNVAHMRTLRAMIELAEKWQKVVREYLAEKEKLTSKLNPKDFGLGNYAQHILDAKTNEQLNNLLKKSQESLATAEKQLKRSNQKGSKNPNAEAKIKEEENIQKLIEARRKELQENPRVSRVDEFGVYTETGFHLLDEDKEELMKKAEELAKPYMRKNLVEIMREIFTGTKLDNGKDINAELLAYAVSSTFVEDIKNNKLSDEVIKEMKEELNNVSLSLSTSEGLLSERLAEAEEMYGENFVKNTILPTFKEVVTLLSKGKASTSAKPAEPSALSAPKTGTISEQRKKEIAEETNEQDLYQAQLQLKQNIENYRKLKKIDSDQQQQLANMTVEFNLITKRLRELEIARNKQARNTPENASGSPETNANGQDDKSQGETSETSPTASQEASEASASAEPQAKPIFFKSSGDSKYRFLSNFFLTRIKVGKHTYPSVEHAFQAAKTDKESEKKQFYATARLTAKQAKAAGRKVTLRDLWNITKYDTLKDLVRIKFQNEKLKERLLATGNAALYEQTGDTTYGVNDKLEGQNMLGEILMDIRQELGGSGIPKSYGKRRYPNKIKIDRNNKFYDMDGVSFTIEFVPREEFHNTVGEISPDKKIKIANDFSKEDLYKPGYKLSDSTIKKLESYGIDYNKIRDSFTEDEALEFIVQHERWHQKQIEKFGSYKEFSKYYNWSVVNKWEIELDALIMPLFIMNKISGQQMRNALNQLERESFAASYLEDDHIDLWRELSTAFDNFNDRAFNAANLGTAVMTEINYFDKYVAPFLIHQGYLENASKEDIKRGYPYKFNAKRMKEEEDKFDKDPKSEVPWLRGGLKTADDIPSKPKPADAQISHEDGSGSAEKGGDGKSPTTLSASDSTASQAPKSGSQATPVSKAGEGYINHSGGATGSDSYWGEIGSKYGVTNNHYYYGKKTPTGNKEITKAEFEEGKQHVLEANKTLKRKPDNYMNLLARNWFQVKNADTVFAIADKLVKTKDGIEVVDGGTGWAVQMAIDNRKPVYVFNQQTNEWLYYDYQMGAFNNWDETPKLTKNFAGIGTRGLKENGKKAIEAVYEATFDKLPDASNTSSGASQSDQNAQGVQTPMETQQVPENGAEGPKSGSRGVPWRTNEKPASRPYANYRNTQRKPSSSEDDSEDLRRMESGESFADMAAEEALEAEEAAYAASQEQSLLESNLGPKPKPEDFNGDVDAYIDALTAWNEKKEAQAKAEEGYSIEDMAGARNNDDEDGRVEARGSMNLSEAIVAEGPYNSNGDTSTPKGKAINKQKENVITVETSTVIESPRKLNKEKVDLHDKVVDIYVVDRKSIKNNKYYGYDAAWNLYLTKELINPTEAKKIIKFSDKDNTALSDYLHQFKDILPENKTINDVIDGMSNAELLRAVIRWAERNTQHTEHSVEAQVAPMAFKLDTAAYILYKSAILSKSKNSTFKQPDINNIYEAVYAKATEEFNENKKKLPTNTSRNYLRVLGDFRSAELIANSFKDLKASEYETSTLTHKDRLSAKIINTPNDRVSDIKEKPVDENGNSYLARQITISKGDCWVSAKANIYKKFLDTRRKLYEAIGLLPIDKKYATSPTEAKDINGKPTGKYRSMLDNSPHIRLLYNIEEKGGKLYFTFNETVLAVTDFSFIEFVAGSQFPKYMNPKDMDDVEVCRMWGLNPDTATNEEKIEARNLMKLQGIPKTIMANNLGRLILENLGIKPNFELGYADSWERLASGIGAFALDFGAKYGLYDFNTFEPKQGTYEWLTARSLNLIKPNVNTTRITNDLRDQYLGTSTVGKGAHLGNGLNRFKVTDSDSNAVPIFNRAPKLDREKAVYVHNTKQDLPVSETQLDVLDKAQHQAYKFDMEVVDFMLEHENEIAARLGYIETFNNAAYDDMSFEARESALGVNSSIVRSFEALKMYAPMQKDFEDTEDFNGIFFKCFISKNGRFFINSNMLNPQIQKLHRFCCVPIKAFKTYKTNFVEKSDEWYCENFAIAQAFDKLGNREAYIDFAEKMKSLDLEQLNTLRTHLITLSESQFALACERDFEIKGIGIESLPQCLSTIQHLIRRRRAMDNNQDEYESCLMVENDSTTSGYAIKLLNMPLESTTEFLEKVGVFMFLNDELQTGEIELSEEQKKQLDFTMDELKKVKGFVDIYRTSAVKVSQKIKELEADNYKALRQNFEAKIITNVKRKVKKDIIEEYHKKGEKITDDVLEELVSKRATEIAEKEAEFMVKLYQKLRPALPTVDENGKVDSFFRQLMKDPTMVFGYSAGMRSISSKVSGNLMEKTINQYLDIIKQDGETAKDKVENYLVNVIGYRSDEVLKQASKSKDKIESTSAQSEIQEKEKARVQALAVFDAMTHIEEHSGIKLAAKLKTNMTTEIYVKRSKDEKAYATTLNAMFNMLIGTTYGDTTGEVLEKQFRHYVCVNNLMIWMSSTMAQMYIQRKGREVSIQRNKDYRGEITYKELNTIDEKLYKEGVTPYTTLASNTARNDARMLLYKTKKVVNPISEVQDYNSNGEENKLTSTVYADIRVPDTPGRAGAVIPIHGMDGDIIMNTFLKFVDTVGINMIHDAICMSALDQIAVTKHYINSLLNTTYNYDMFNTLYSHFIRCIEAEEKNPANKGNFTIVRSRLIQKDKGNDRNIYTDEFDKHLNPNSIKNASEEHLKFVDDATREQSEDPIPITIGMLQQVAEKWGKLIADRKAWLFSHKLFCVNMGGTKGCNSTFQSIKDGNGESGFKEEDTKRNPDKKTFGSSARGFRTNGEIDLNRTEAISDPNARVGFLNDLHDMSASLNNTTCSEEHMKHLRDFVKAVKPETMIDAIVELTDNGLFNAGQFLKEASGKSVIKITLDSRDNIDNFTKVAVESHLLSPEEIYAHEIVHAALLPAFMNAGVFGYYREMTLLQSIYREASKVITWKDFMPQEGKFDPSRISEYEAYAKETWDYIFNNPDYKTNRGLMEFCAYFTTSEKLRNILKERFTDKYNDEIKATKFIDKLINLVKNIFKVLFTKEKFRDIFGRTYNVAKGLDTVKKQNLYNQFNTLINQMALANTKASNKLMEHPRKLLENMFVFLGSMINRYNRPLGQWLKKHTIELADTKGWFNLEDRLIKLDGSFLDKAKLYSTCLALYPISRRHRKAWKHLLTNILNISQQGILMSTVRDITKPDEDSSKFELLSVKNRGLDAASKSIEANVRENLKEHFGRNLTNDEQIALTNVILRTDLQSLYDGKNIDYIVNLIKDSQFLYDEINCLDAEIGKIYTKHDDYHWIMGQCLGLARYMVTGKGNEQLNMNARNIALGRLYDKILPFTKESEELISKMTSLFALQHTPETQKKALLALPKKGYENFIQVHKEFVEETMEGLKLDDTDMSKRTPIIDKIHITKGYTKQLLDTTYETTINLADKATQQALAKQGYSLVYIINPDDVTKHAEPLGLYRRFGIPKRRDGASAALQGYDAIGTSLTDMSYWDIETSSTGDFITNEENRKRLVEAYKKNADTISAKLLRRMKGAPMTFEEFDRFSSGFSPIASTDSKTNGISDYRITMSYANKRQALGLDERGIEVLSKMYASINKKAQSTAVNNSLLEYLYDYMDKNMDFNTHRKLNDSTQKFVEIAERTNNEYLQKAWRVLPKEFKEAIKKRRLWVRNDWLQDLFGVANMSLNDTKWVQKIPYGWVKRFIALAEYVLKTIAYYRKEAIVLKIPSVLIGNLISNFMYSVANHMNPVKVFKLTLANGKAIREYIDTKKELNRIIFKQRLGTATNEELSRKNMLKAKLEANITHPLMEKGMYQSIVEDLDPEELESTGKMTKLLKYNKVSDKVPGGVKTAIKSLYLAKGTPIHDFMFTATQYSDFIARCVEYQLSMEKAKETYERIKKEKTTPENAEYKLMDYDEFYKKYEEKTSIRVLNAFINYDKPQSEWEQYLNDLGLLFFTKFGKRIQHVIAEQLWENPLGALAFILTQNLLIDTEDIFEQNLFNKNWTALVSNPIDNFVGAAVPMPLQYLLGTQKAF